MDRRTSKLLRPHTAKVLHWPGCVLVKADAAPHIAAVENMAFLSRNLLCSGEGLIGGVMGVFGIGNILMLSSVSAPSRVPQVVCCANQPRVNSNESGAGHIPL